MRWRILATASASLAIAGNLPHPAGSWPLAATNSTTMCCALSAPAGMTGPETDMRNSSPTEEDVLNALRSGPESTESSSEPFHQSVEDQRFIDRIRTDRTRQLALGTQRAPIDKRAPRIELEVNFEFNSATIGRKAEPQLISLGSALTSSELKGKAFL